MSEYQNKSLIKRVKRNTNFTHLSNEVFNSSLSPDALGVLCYILHLPDDWVIHKTHLQKVFNVGRERMDRIFKDIESAGFLVQMEMVRVGGKFIGRNYLFYDEPQNKPMLEKPLTTKPTSADTQLLNTNKLNTNNTKTPISPKGDLGKNIDNEEINYFIDRYCEVYAKRMKIVLPKSTLSKREVKNGLFNLQKVNIDFTKPLDALWNMAENQWEIRNGYPSASIKKLLTQETIRKYGSHRKAFLS